MKLHTGSTSRVCLLGIIICFLLTVSQAGKTRTGPSSPGLQITPVLIAQADNYLASPHVDRANKFSIRPPLQWWKSTRSRRFALKLSSRNYKAFILVDVIKTEGKVEIDRDFLLFIRKKNREIADRVPSFDIKDNRHLEVNGREAYRTHATFMAGQNEAVIKIYYIPGKTRLYMITTVSPEFTNQRWLPYLRASVNSFTILE